MAKRLNRCASADMRIFDHAIGGNRHAVFQRDITLKHTTDINADVAPADQLATHIDVPDQAGLHLVPATAVRYSPDEYVQVRQLHFAVHAQRFPDRIRLRRYYRHTVSTARATMSVR
jgi:hypothetical protein